MLQSYKEHVTTLQSKVDNKMQQGVLDLVRKATLKSQISKSNDTDKWVLARQLSSEWAISLELFRKYL